MLKGETIIKEIMQGGLRENVYNQAMLRGDADNMLFNRGLIDLIYKDSSMRMSALLHVAKISKLSLHTGTSQTLACSLTAECEVVRHGRPVLLD